MNDSVDPQPDIEGASEFMVATGLKFDEVSPARVTGWIELGPGHHQPFGIVHGGVYTSAIETAASVGATAAVADQGMIAVGVNNNTNFVASMSGGRVRLVATPLVQSRTQQLWNVTVTRDADDRLVATGQVRLQNITPRS